MDTQSNSARRLRSICSTLAELRGDYETWGQDAEAEAVEQAEEAVRGLFGLPEPGDES